MVCLEYKCCSIDYFLDTMKYYELDPIINNVGISVKSSWEQSRLIAYIMAQVNSTKQLKPTDILSFEWDDKEKETKSIEMTKELREKMLLEAKERETLLKQKGII